MTEYKWLGKMVLAGWITGVALTGEFLKTESAQALTLNQTIQSVLEFRNSGDNTLIGTGTLEYSTTPLSGNYAYIVGLDEQGDYYYNTTYYTDPSQLPDLPYILNFDEVSVSGLYPAQVSISFLDGYSAGGGTTGGGWNSFALFFNPYNGLTSTIRLTDPRYSNDIYGDILKTDSWDFVRNAIGIGPVGLQVYGGGTFTYYDPTGNASDGYWTVNAVPEPLTLGGATIATSFGIFFKRKLSKKKKLTIG